MLVDGRPRPKGYRVRAGERLALLPREERAQPVAESPDLVSAVRIVAAGDWLAAVFKPAGLHSARIAGREHPAGLLPVEDMLPEFWPGRAPVLLNRLDRDTSGLLLVGLSPDAPLRYRAEENAGRVLKEYLALVHGRLSSEHICRAVLDVDDRAVVGVKAVEEADPLRWTCVVPLRQLSGPDPRTLVRARIRKGARHQIRAHLAGMGCPIVGDVRYGRDCAGPLYLHHERVMLPGFEARCPAPWPEELLPDVLL